MALLKRRCGRVRADFARLMVEGLESRLLLTVTAVHDTGNVTTNGTNLQNAVNAAAYGDTIVLDAGVKYVVNLNLPSKAGTGTITIQSSALASLPAGVRVSPSQAALMPKILCTGGADSMGASAVTAAASSHDYTLQGIELGSNQAVNNPFNSIVAIGVNGPGQTSTSQVPANFTIDRCYVHGTPGYDSKIGISLNGNGVTVSNCYINEIHSTIQDCQGISGSNGIGNYTITNNYIEASTENILFGGADPTITTPGFLPNDNILVQGNYFYKPMTWNPYSTQFVPLVNTRNATYWVKNLFELKNAAHVTINNNIFENNWAGADQFGFAIVFTPRNQGGTDPTARITNVNFTNNIVRHSGAGMSILGGDGSESSPTSAAAHDFLVQNNVFQDIGGPQFGAKGGQGFQISCGGHTADNITIDHNIMFDTFRTMWAINGNLGGKAANHFNFTNNIVYRGSAGMAAPGPLTEGSSAINGSFTTPVVTGNLFIGANAGSYPAGNFFPATADAVGFIDFAGENYGLIPGTTYKGVGGGGSDPGVNMAALDPEYVPPSSGLQGFWQMNESAGSGTTADSSGNGKTGTVSNATFTTGQTLNGLSFNGTSSVVTVPTFAAPTSLTLTAFVKPSDHTGTASNIITKGGSEFALRINSAGNLEVTVAGVTLTDTSFNYFAAGNNNKWYLVGATFDAATDSMKLFRNGVQVATVANAGTVTDSGLALWIGRDVETNAGSFLGMMDDVRYLNRALTPTEMAEMYTNYLPQLDYIRLPNDPNYTQATTGTTGTMGTYAAVSHGASGNLTFTWSTFSKPAGAADPTFSANGTNAAKNTTITFKAAGTYVFACTVTDPSGVSSTFLTTPRVQSQQDFNHNVQMAYNPVIVNQTLTSVGVTPTPVNVANGAQQQFTAAQRDQFGNAMATQTGSFTWTLQSGIGGVNASGLYTAPASGTGSAVVKATNGAFSGTATVNVVAVPTVVSINRANSDPTNAGTVNFTVTFSTAVTGVDATDFALAASGVSGPSIGTVTGSGTTWTVPVNTGTGSGSIGLNLVDNDTIVAGSVPLGGSGANNGNFTGQVYTVDKTAPVVSVTSPTAGAMVSGTTPTIAGNAGILSGDLSTITVKIYAGGTATGSPVSTFTTTANGAGAFSVSAPSLPEGRYTVQVSQSDSAGNTGLSTAVTYAIYNTIAGDANNDGTVNFADYVVVSNHYGQATAAGVSAGDFNFDGVVNFADYVIISNNYGQTAALTLQSSFVAATPTGPVTDSGSTEGVLAGSVVEDKVGKGKGAGKQVVKEAKLEAKEGKGKK